MKNIELLHEVMQTTEDLQIKNLIKRFILLNSNDKRDKFNFYNYCVKKDDIRPWAMGVYYSNGFKYATNHHLAIKVKCDYNPEFEGKILGSKMQEIEGNFPNVDQVIPNDRKRTFVDFDFSKVLNLETEYKLDKKIGIEIGVIEFKGFKFNFSLFLLMAKFAINFNITQIGYSDNKDLAIKIGRGTETVGVLMPLASNMKIDDKVKIYKLRYKHKPTR